MVSPKDRFVTVYGRNPVIEVLDDPSLVVDKVVLAEGVKGHGIGEIIGLARDRGVPVERASADRVKKLAGNAKATFVGLRGTQQQVDAAQAAAHITLAEDDGETHSAQVLLYGPDDYARVSFLQSNTEQQAMKHDLPIVAK